MDLTARLTIAEAARLQGILSTSVTFSDYDFSTPRVGVFRVFKAGGESRTVSGRIFIVDDHTLTRKGYSVLLEDEPLLQICGEAAGVEDALEQIPQLGPDLAIVDLSLGNESGLELIKKLESSSPDLAILVVSMHDESLYAERALRAGAEGYVMKGESPETLHEAILKVANGGIYLSDRMSKSLLSQFLNRPDELETSPLDQLTDRELETFEFVGRGLSTGEIAEAMSISPKTVGTYRRRIKSKLGIDNSTQLVRHAVRWIEDAGTTGQTDLSLG
jgi:DNA-binding NarL/FixJ family response regulator